MSSIKPATVWWCLEKTLTPEEIVRISAELGYAGIELAPEEEFPRIAEAGLAIASHRGHDTLEDGLNRHENHDRIEREILANLNVAQRWGIPTLICFSGNRNGLDDDTGAEATAEGLRRVASAAEHAGVTLALELLNSRVDHPDYQADCTAWGVQVCEAVDSPAVKLLYDIYHMQIMEGDVIRTIRQHAGWVGHYHLAGNPGRNEPDETQELNYPAILAAIRDTGFDGYLGMEFIPSRDPREALREAILLTGRV